MTAPLEVRRAGGVTRVTLCRPEVHNAFDEKLIAALTAAFEEAGRDPACRIVLLAARGRSFSAGADLNWMRRMAGLGPEENRADALALARLMETIDSCPRPTLARVQGAAFGGGVGLIACCDIVVATERARFCLSEVKLGLAPAVISPYVVRAMGARAARRYFLTAERFDAAEARRLGLVHHVVAEGELEPVLDGFIAALAQGGPRAQEATKQLIERVSGRDPGAVAEETAALIARLRASEEGQEGLAAFFEKRPPRWAE